MTPTTKPMNLTVDTGLPVAAPAVVADDRRDPPDSPGSRRRRSPPSPPSSVPPPSTPSRTRRGGRGCRGARGGRRGGGSPNQAQSGRGRSSSRDSDAASAGPASPRSPPPQSPPQSQSESQSQSQSQSPHHSHDAPMTKKDIYFALDCEMVGVGPAGADSALARVVLLNYDEEVVLDQHVRVDQAVTDYRTFVSGITEADLRPANTISLDRCRRLVSQMLHGKILIGHGLQSDLAALGITHPWRDVRDTARYGPYMRRVSSRDREVGTNAVLPRRLRDLVRAELGKEIQAEGAAHDPKEDALGALDLYKRARADWERDMIRQVKAARELEEASVRRAEQHKRKVAAAQQQQQQRHLMPQSPPSKHFGAGPAPISPTSPHMVSGFLPASPISPPHDMDMNMRQMYTGGGGGMGFSPQQHPHAHAPPLHLHPMDMAMGMLPVRPRMQYYPTPPHGQTHQLRHRQQHQR